MGLVDRLRGERRKFDRKKDARHEAHKRIARAKDRIVLRRQLREQAFAAGRTVRAHHLTNLIADDLRKIDNLEDQIKKLSRILGNTREDIRTLARRLRRRRRGPKVVKCTTPGSPCYGGSRDLFWHYVVRAVGTNPHSTKRSETFGNPTSDHHISQILAYAGDFPPSVEAAIRVARALGIGYNGYADDYKLYYVEEDGLTFRVQIIARNHGTGPHLHVGIERV